MKALMITAAVLTLSLPAYAEGTNATEVGIEPMPASVQASIEELRQYGDRFEKAIAAIEAQWAKPMWSDGADCEEISDASEKPGS